MQYLAMWERSLKFLDLDNFENLISSFCFSVTSLLKYSWRSNS